MNAVFTVFCVIVAIIYFVVTWINMKVDVRCENKGLEAAEDLKRRYGGYVFISKGSTVHLINLITYDIYQISSNGLAFKSRSISPFVSIKRHADSVNKGESSILTKYELRGKLSESIKYAKLATESYLKEMREGVFNQETALSGYSLMLHLAIEFDLFVE